MTQDTEGLTADLLFVAATRPPTRWGVPYLALLINMVVTMEIFLMVKNPHDAALGDSHPRRVYAPLLSRCPIL